MGKKDPSRKKPKRKQKPDQRSIDADLAELATVLDLTGLAPSVEALFGPPWRNGWLAAELAHSCWSAFRYPTNVDHPNLGLALQIGRWLSARDRSGLAYELAEEAKDHLRRSITNGASVDPADEFLVAALRCIQLVISNSHGGGDVFNASIRAAFAVNPEERLVIVQEMIAMYRCRDAIGTQLSLMNDANDHIRRAFRIAWNRGLYQAAYALPRVA